MSIVILDGGEAVFTSADVYVLDVAALRELDPETGSEAPADVLAVALAATAGDPAASVAVLAVQKSVGVTDDDLAEAVALLDNLASKGGAS